MRSSLTVFLFALMLHEPVLSAKEPDPSSRGVLALDVAASGETIHLLTAESDGREAAALLHRSSADGGDTWSPGIRVDTGQAPAFSPHRGMDPRIAASGDRLVAVWTIAGTDAWGSGPLATAWSVDGGRSWKAGPNPSDSGLTTGHGFLDLAADGEGSFHLVWLDSRDGRQGLRYSRSHDGGVSWEANRTLATDTCQCCRNTLATGPGGEVGVLYRHGDPRDMRFRLSLDRGATWSDPNPAGDFGWRFEGCPHVGGGLAIAGGEGGAAVHALVWTGMEAKSGVHYGSFAGPAPDSPEPRRFGGSSSTHPDLSAGRGGTVLAVWQDPVRETGPLLACFSSDGGKSWTSPFPVEGASPSATHPIAIATEAGFRVFWTETPPEGQAIWSSASIEP